MQQVQTMNSRWSDGRGQDRVVDHTQPNVVRQRDTGDAGAVVKDYRLAKHKRSYGVVQPGWGWRWPFRIPQAAWEFAYTQEQRFYRWIKEFFT